MNQLVEAMKQWVAEREEGILHFFREIVAIPSMDNQIGAVGDRVGEEMTRLGFDQVYRDRYGSIVGRVGNGEKILLLDSHLDTVGIGDPKAWEWDPFQGKVENGMLYARGALDEKGSTPGMVYGMAMARDLGLLEGFTVYCLGNIEEICDGVACQAFHEWEKINPDFVVIGEPTNMNVYRGHKGRVELEVVAKGRSAHAASNYLGDNAIYKMAPLLQAIEKMDATLPDHPFLGQGRITVSRISSVSPSDNSVPEECRVFIDRRVTIGETKEGVMAQLGGHAQFVDSTTTQISHGDTAKEIGEILGRYNDAIAIRQCQSLILLMTRYGMNVRLTRPPEFKLMPEIVEQARDDARKHGGSLEILEDFDAGFKGADVIYAKSWGSLMTTTDHAESARISQRYQDWITDDRRMALAKKDAIYMHCLPADRNIEVTDSVIEGPRSVVYQEAENRLHVAKAVMALTM